MTLASTIERPDAAAWSSFIPCHVSEPAFRLPDPLEEDGTDDVPFITTERRLQRLVIVACDTGARFAREGLTQDPAAWMLAPRRLFDGARPLEACQERAAFMRATLLHGLSLGLDADPSELDALINDDDDDFCEDDVGEDVLSPDRKKDGMHLYTCTLEGRFGSRGRCIQAFCAMVAADEEVVRRRLSVRYGERLSAAAIVLDGYDPASVLAQSLLSPSVSRMLEAVARNPNGELADGLDLQVEQRFAA